MKYKILTFILIVLTIILNNNVIVSVESDSNIIVTTNNGRIKGNTYELNNKTISEFIGIRYAESPVDDLRFAKPKPVKSWDGIYDATTVGTKGSCWQKLQLSSVDVVSEKDFTLSEDCLFLNIWTPNLGNHSSEKELMPVMFWIHGGGYASGGAFLKLYNGGVYASRDVVFVSINYRLNVFGFLYDGTEHAPGNMGLWDQVLALKWVNDNIKFFGGNPKEITIFGESAGSGSVSQLIVSPVTKNLFKRGIMESGAGYSQKENTKEYKDSNTNTAKKMAKDLGNCTGIEWINCLKKIDAKKIADYFGKNTLIGNKFTPIYGDDLIPKSGHDALKMGEFNKGLELMAGFNSEEGSLVGNVFGDLMKNETITKVKLKQYIQLAKSIYFSELKVTADEIYDFYLGSIDESDQITLKRAFGRIFGDYIIGCPTYYFAKDYALSNVNDTTYFYYFSYKSENVSLIGCTQKWMGVCHAEELAFVFGLPLRYPQKFTKIDAEFSKNVLQLWTNFAKTGNPLKPEKFSSTISWPSFRENRESSVIPKIFEINPYKFGTIHTDMFKSNCDGFWKQYIQ